MGDTEFMEIALGPQQVRKTVSEDGTIHIQSTIPLQDHPDRITERLVQWAGNRPDQTFLAEKDAHGNWTEYSYARVLALVQSIGQYLLESNVTTEKPLVILSGNSVSHGLMALGALHVGLPYTPVAPAYSLKATDYTKLRHVIEQLTPGLFFVEDGQTYENALKAVGGGIPVVAVNRPVKDATPFGSVLTTKVTDQVAKSHEKVGSGTVAKVLFTSGSTGMPKGVINTHGNITTNWQQITQTFPFMKDDFVIIDWLPWNHTFGGNHNFGLTLYNGGTMYLDDGNPTPGGIRKTVENLKEIAPTTYFNVPKGFNELINYLRDDGALREKFFSRLQMLFYAGAGMPQHTWNALEELAVKATGKKVFIGTGLGCTESSPSALFSTKLGGHSGLLGLPVPGMALKMKPNNGKMEAHFKGGNVTPGYWRDDELTAGAFDEEGYYRTGDALKFEDPEDVKRGLVFDGRIKEDFKLDTGTWVHVGAIRNQLIAMSEGLITDAVITGLDRPFIGAIVFPDVELCCRRLNKKLPLAELAVNPALKDAFQGILDQIASKSTGSANLVKRILLADFELQHDTGELTDKGSVNQRKVLELRQDQVEKIYSAEAVENLVETN